MAEHRTLEQLWKAGRDGGLSPLDQVRVVAYRDAYNEVGLPPKSGGPALLGTIAKKVTKIGGGHPSKEAIRQPLPLYLQLPPARPPRSCRPVRMPAPISPPAPFYLQLPPAKTPRSRQLPPSCRTVVRPYLRSVYSCHFQNKKVSQSLQIFD